MPSIEDYNKKSQQAFFNTEATFSYDFRMVMLERFEHMMRENEANIAQAVEKDFGKSAFESYATEVLTVYEELKYFKKNLKKLMRPERVPSSLIHFYTKSTIHLQPLGLTLIISPWNYPINLALSPLIGAIAAGNCAVLKPSEMTPTVAQLLDDMIAETFPADYITVVQGDGEDTQNLIKQDFDHVFFTGSPAVGKEIMKTAAETLTPVTLELGGKSPAIVTKDADIVKAVARIAWGKYINGGQTCIAPDYILVHESVADDFLTLLQRTIEKFYGPNPLESEDYPSIINEKHFERIAAYIHQGELIYGGKTDAGQRKIEQTVILNPSLDSPVMQEEIFGPILPVITYKRLKEALDIIKDRPDPLALYVFSENQSLIDYLVETVSFGGGTVNDTIIHISNVNLPFGGVGNSGMGSYHGKYSFRTFSHFKSISQKTTCFDIPFRYPPYDDWKLNVLKKVMRWPI